MKQFSIHKINKPQVVGSLGRGGDIEEGADEVADISKQGLEGDEMMGGGGYNGNQEQPSMTSNDDRDPNNQQMKVVNPWIHEATHKEYLENVKVRDILILKLWRSLATKIL